MTDTEVVASLLMQINNLKARILAAEEDNLTWQEQEELSYLEDKLFQMEMEGIR